MSFRTICASCSVALGLLFFPSPAFSEVETSSKYKVLSSEKSGLNLSTINTFLDQAQVAINNGDLDEATKKFKKARTVSNLLLGYYRDLNGAFRGLDALIPREMSKKNREVVQLLAKANLQLAALHRKKGEPELAVPLLVEVVKILTPANPQGSKAYQALVELGFVETPYRGGRQSP